MHACIEMVTWLQMGREPSFRLVRKSSGICSLWVEGVEVWILCLKALFRLHVDTTYGSFFGLGFRVQ